MTPAGGRWYSAGAFTYFGSAGAPGSRGNAWRHSLREHGERNTGAGGARIPQPVDLELPDATETALRSLQA